MTQRMSCLGSINGAPARAIVDFDILPHLEKAHIDGRIESQGYRYTFHAEGHPTRSSFVGGLTDLSAGGYNETHVRIDFNSSYDFVMTVNPFANDSPPPRYYFQRR
jgi:hypothetical protein